MAADAARDLVGPTRLPARRQPRSARGDRRGRGRPAALRPRPRLLASAGHGPARPGCWPRCTPWTTTFSEAGGPGLSVVRGRPAAVVPRVARSVEAREVHVSADFGPYGRSPGRARSRRPWRRSDLELIRTGSPYAVAPGTLQNKLRRPVPGVHPVPPRLARARRARPGPRRTRQRGELARGRGPGRPGPPGPALVAPAGEKPARRAWQAGCDADSEGVGRLRQAARLPRSRRHLAPVHRPALGPPAPPDRAGRPRRAPVGRARPRWPGSSPGGTSSPTCCSTGPDAVTQPIRPEFTQMPTDEPDQSATAAERLEAWQQGRTGYPLVDAGMRQLLAEGWMHNRVRMVVASFLIKDLHIGWWHGADWFMDAPARRRHRPEPAELAVGRRLRHRPRAVLPDLQPDRSGGEVRRRRGATSAATCPSWPTYRSSTCTSRGGPRAGRRRAIPRRSSTTRPSARRPSTGTP